jgi:2-hydroxychromene-2-carboxylate isomerase
VLPRLVVALSQVTGPARAGAAVRRALGGRGRVELYVALDDPCSAVALEDLAARLAGRPADLVVLPVVARGIDGDPAVQDKRRYALADARRLAARRGLALSRDHPLDATATGEEAARVAGIADDRERLAACRAVSAALWLGGDRPPPAGSPDAGALRRNERRMRRRGPYDTPAAVVGGRWFFAHDRPAQIVDWLDELGWRAPS